MLRAGYASVDITPPADCALLGYEFRQRELPAGSSGVLDRLRARALVLDPSGGEGARGDSPSPHFAALVSLDLCIVEADLARRLRAAAARKLGGAEERVIVACTHTHSGPFPRIARPPRRSRPDPVARILRGSDAGYAAQLERAVCEAAATARGLLYPVQLAVREAPFGMGYDRRVVGAGGVRHCWNPQESPELDPAPMPDPTCTVAVLRQTNGPRRFIAWSVGAHAVSLGKTSRVVSADWPGAACAMIDDSAQATHSLFFSGAAGDVHPWVATQERPDGMLLNARAAASFVSLLAEAAAPMTDGGLSIASRTLRLGGSRLDVSVWNLQGLWIVALPVELFGQLGVELRRRLGGPVLLATVANGWTGYWPTRRAFEQGGYEVEAARASGRKAGDGERLIEEVVAIAQRAGRR